MITLEDVVSKYRGTQIQSFLSAYDEGGNTTIIVDFGSENSLRFLYSANSLRTSMIITSVAEVQRKKIEVSSEINLLINRENPDSCFCNTPSFCGEVYESGRKFDDFMIGPFLSRFITKYFEMCSDKRPSDIYFRSVQNKFPHLKDDARGNHDLLFIQLGEDINRCEIKEIKKGNKKRCEKFIFKFNYNSLLEVVYKSNGKNTCIYRINRR
ncbi:MAG TPA: hypothetical protein VI894_00080 [Candidatus Nanoarchaeia archaeon]|nr:hypothetical protein [Candidatus Nanoarchaeia archaeon]